MFGVKLHKGSLAGNRVLAKGQQITPNRSKGPTAAP